MLLLTEAVVAMVVVVVVVAVGAATSDLRPLPAAAGNNVER